MIVPGAVNCVLDFFIIMLVSHPDKHDTCDSNGSIAHTSALAAADHGFAERSFDRDLCLRRVVSSNISSCI